MSVAPQDMFGVGHNLPQMAHTSPPGLNGSSQLGHAQSAMNMFQSPSAVSSTAITSPPPGFSQPALRTQLARRTSQTNSPMGSIHGMSVVDSPALATGKSFSQLELAIAYRAMSAPLLKGIPHTHKLRRPLINAETAFISRCADISFLSTIVLCSLPPC